MKFNNSVARVNLFPILFRSNCGACSGSCPMNRSKDSVLSALSDSPANRCRLLAARSGRWQFPDVADVPLARRTQLRYGKSASSRLRARAIRRRFLLPSLEPPLLPALDFLDALGHGQVLRIAPPSSWIGWPTLLPDANHFEELLELVPHLMPTMLRILATWSPNRC